MCCFRFCFTGVDRCWQVLTGVDRCRQVLIAPVALPSAKDKTNIRCIVCPSVRKNLMCNADGRWAILLLLFLAHGVHGGGWVAWYVGHAILHRSFLAAGVYLISASSYLCCFYCCCCSERCNGGKSWSVFCPRRVLATPW